jgi:hypothetical protein
MVSPGKVDQKRQQRVQLCSTRPPARTPRA